MILNKYSFIEELNKGSFGTIFKAQNNRTKELVAIKVESKEQKIQTLKMEAKICQYLSHIDGFPKLKWFSSDDKYNYLVIELLGHSLEHVISSININLFKSICIQIIDRIEILHNKYLLHRDIKPQNFLFGLNTKSDTLFIIDFGFSKRWYLDNKHIKISFNNKIIGTPNYISLNTHKGIEISRRDDLESCLYVILFLYFGNLDLINDNDIKQIEINKKNLLIKNILPDFLKELFIYVRNLEFEETPNYNYIKNIINKTI